MHENSDHSALRTAQLDWDECGQPRSSAFDDVYFSRASGIEETRFVFLEHNRLRPRWQALAPGSCFTIAETGFGTGLNFLCAWQLWRQTAPEEACLHFVSVEKFPLTRADLERALSLWPELGALSEALLAAYPPAIGGFHRLLLDQGRVQLTLIFDDVLSALPELAAPVDAWFLDGFAPAKNPQMWQPTLFAEMARLSHPGTSVATFTCAGLVKRGLKGVGFAIDKVPGFGHKREMLIARYAPAQMDCADSPLTGRWPRWQRPAPSLSAQQQKPEQALVIGGGIAGLSTARALAERGLKVTVLEAAPALARGASGNPQGMLYLKLSAHATPLTQLALASYPLALQQIARLLPGEDQGDAPNWQRSGLMQLGFNDREQQRLDKLAAAEALPDCLLQAKTAAELSELAGIAIEHDGLWYPDGAWVEPPALCQALARHAHIRIITDAPCQRLERSGAQWQVCDRQGRQWHAEVVVIAAGEASAALLPGAETLPLKPIRGQITELKASPASQQLRAVVCHDGYIAPARAGRHTLGATFNMGETDLALTERDHRHNLEQLAQNLPALAHALAPPRICGGRAALRCTTPDYLPLIGPAADSDAFCTTFAHWRKDARAELDLEPPYYPGLYLNCGHGSRGMVTGPLSGALIASWVLGEPAPLPWSLTEALHPARFLVRGLKKGKL